MLELFEIFINFIPLKVILLMATFSKDEYIFIFNKEVFVSHLIIFLILFAAIAVFILNNLKKTPGGFIKLKPNEKKEAITFFSLTIALIVIVFHPVVGIINLIYIFTNIREYSLIKNIDLANYFQGLILLYILVEYYVSEPNSLIIYIVMIAGTRLISVKQKIYNSM